MSRSFRFSLFVAAAVSLAACSGDDNGETFGKLSLAVTDAPVDAATAVVVEFTGVEIKHSGEEQPEVFTFAEPRRINLLDLQGSASEALFTDETVPSGQYDWIRLLVNAERGVADSYIELESGAQHSLWVPSGAQSGLKLVSGFVVPAGGEANFTIDFDLRKSVHDPQGNFADYVLRPALRLIDNAEAGILQGEVSNSLVGADCEPAIYLFDGNDATPDDVDGNEPDPLASANVTLDETTGIYAYTIGFVAPGAYTAALTCDADDDAPDRDDTLAFDHAQNVTIVTDQTTEANFE